MNKLMSEYNWLMLAKMIDRYGSLITAFDYLSIMYPDNLRIKQLKDGLEKGDSFNELLGKDKFEKQLMFYCQYISISDAIKVIYATNNKNNSLRKEFVSKVIYQLIVLVLSLVVLGVFTKIVLPQMVEILQLSSNNINYLLSLFNLLNIVKDIILIFIGLIIIFFLYVRLSKRENYLWNYLHQLKLDKTFKVFVTYRFVGQLKIILENGIDLNKAIEILRFDNEDKLIKMLAFHFNEDLINGKQFEEALDNEFFDDRFHSICLYGIANDDFISSLNDYLMFVEDKIRQLLNEFSIIINVICYSFAAIVIVLAYQVLMLPLDLLEGL